MPPLPPILSTFAYIIVSDSRCVVQNAHFTFAPPRILAPPRHLASSAPVPNSKDGDWRPSCRARLKKSLGPHCKLTWPFIGPYKSPEGGEPWRARAAAGAHALALHHGHAASALCRSLSSVADIQPVTSHASNNASLISSRLAPPACGTSGVICLLSHSHLRHAVFKWGEVKRAFVDGFGRQVLDD